MSKAEDVIDTLLAADLAAVQRELRQLRAIRDWAAKQAADFGPGDRVTIAEPLPCNDGWAPYREALALGATGVVQAIDFNQHRDRWYAEVVLDREWSVGTLHGGRVVRWWHGPADETPDGMERPTKYDQEHYPDGRKHTFALRVEWLAAEQPEGSDRRGR